jgi:hypothetical protein
MMFGETVAVYCENRSEHISAQCWYLKSGGADHYHFGLKGVYFYGAQNGKEFIMCV